MRINVNNLDLDKLDDETIPVERIVKKKKDDRKKKIPSTTKSKEKDNYIEEDE